MYQVKPPPSHLYTYTTCTFSTLTHTYTYPSHPHISHTHHTHTQSTPDSAHYLHLSHPHTHTHTHTHAHNPPPTLHTLSTYPTLPQSHVDRYKQAADSLRHKCEGLESQLVFLRKVGDSSAPRAMARHCLLEAHFALTLALFQGSHACAQKLGMNPGYLVPRSPALFRYTYACIRYQTQHNKLSNHLATSNTYIYIYGCTMHVHVQCKWEALASSPGHSSLIPRPRVPYKLESGAWE